MKKKIVANQYEHHFEIDGQTAEYKYTIDLEHGEVIQAKVTQEIQRELRESEDITHINNLF